MLLVRKQVANRSNWFHRQKGRFLVTRKSQVEVCLRCSNGQSPINPCEYLWQLINNEKFSYRPKKAKRNKLQRDYEYGRGLFRTKRHRMLSLAGSKDISNSDI